MRVLVTGSTGFIGSAIVHKLCSMGADVIAAGRAVRPPEHLRRSEQSISWVQVPEFGPDTDWRPALKGVDCVIHCAGAAHFTSSRSRPPLEEFLRINLSGTQSLARTANEFGVRRFIFLSSIGVLGSNTNGRLPFSNLDRPNPQDDYSRSKLSAEVFLESLRAHAEIEIVVIRPPLVFGKDAPGNLQRLMRLVDLGIPIPIGAFDNRRSLVSKENLVDLIIHCVSHPRAMDAPILVRDDQDLSTVALIELLALSQGRRARIVKLNKEIVSRLFEIIGKGPDLDKLVGDLEIDDSESRRRLGWVPPFARERVLCS